MAFLYVSDEMAYGKKHFKKFKDVHFMGSGNGNDMGKVAFDMALLVHSNHTIVSQGSFSFWSSMLCGGDVYTRYGIIGKEVATNSYYVSTYM